MVPPLSKLCLAVVCDQLREHPNPNLYLIPWATQRQELIDRVLAFRVIDRESVYTSLSSPQFLSGFTKFSAQRGVTNDRIFLDRVAESFTQVQSNGKTIGDAITELRLNFYIFWSDARMDLHALNADSVLRMVSRCPNLKTLHLRLVNDEHVQRTNINAPSEMSLFFKVGSTDSGILNQVPALAPCLNVLENLDGLYLTVSGRYDFPQMTTKYPIVQFRRLSSLLLTKTSVDVEAWREFLKTVQGTLTDLKVKNATTTGPGRTVLLPFPLPNLRSFKMRDCGLLTPELINNLMRCPNLELVKIRLQAKLENEGVMQLLSQMTNIVKVKIDFGTPIVEHSPNESTFQWISLLKEKIYGVAFLIDTWSDQHSMALKHLLATCTDLTELQFFRAYNLPEVQFCQHMATVNSILAPLFRDQDWTSKFRKLDLAGPIDYDALVALFENVSDLKYFQVQYCPDLLDDHFQLWASRGGKLKELRVQRCPNVTDRGLMPILASSGERLATFRLTGFDQKRVTDQTWKALIDNCPFVDTSYMDTAFRIYYDARRLGYYSRRPQALLPPLVVQGRSRLLRLLDQFM